MAWLAAAGFDYETNKFYLVSVSSIFAPVFHRFGTLIALKITNGIDVIDRMNFYYFVSRITLLIGEIHTRRTKRWNNIYKLCEGDIVER